MPDQNQQLLEKEYDSTVRADIEQFRAHAEKWLAKEITDDQFRAQRLRRGVYGQRQEGVQMIRTKIPGGLLSSEQMRTWRRSPIRSLAVRGISPPGRTCSITSCRCSRFPTRCICWPMPRMTTREACYNTVRNVTADPLAGLIPSEPFNVQPYAAKVAFAFLHKELTDAMPRKFKIAFAGGDEDTIGTRINDVGLRGLKKDGVDGFRMTVAGGLGPLPTESKVMWEFFPAEEVVSRVEAVIRVFAQYGNYGNKDKARLKFILRERGWEWLQATIEEKYQDILRDGGIPMPDCLAGKFRRVPNHSPRARNRRTPPHLRPSPEFSEWRKSNVRDQKQAGYAIVTVMVPQGNLTGDQMRGSRRSPKMPAMA